MAAASLIVRGADGAFHASGARGASWMTAELLVRALARAAPLAHGTLLDVGCGTKPYRALFAPRVTRHLGVDWPQTLHERSSIDAFADARELPIRTSSVDTVLCTEVLEHCAEPARVFAEARRVLRSGGVLILTTPFLYPVHEAPHDYFRFTRHGLESLVTQAGLTLERVEPIGGFGTVLVSFVARAAQHAAQLAGRAAGHEKLALDALRTPLVLGERAFVAAADRLRPLPGVAAAASHAARLYASGHLVVARRG